MTYTERELPLKDIEPNTGQIEGVPANPRQIDKGRLELLKKSITDNPEMLWLRELIVYAHKPSRKYVIIGGNMRYRALRELGYKIVRCKVIEEATPDQLRAYTIKDNGGFGEWDFDLLANEWDIAELADWGVDVWRAADSDDIDLDVKTRTVNEMVEECGDFIQVSFIFDKERGETVKAFVKEFGKEPITDKIIEVCQNAEVK